MNKIFTTRQVSGLLNIHINTVYNYIHSGVLKAFKLGGTNSVKHWRIREKDLESFMQEAGSAHGDKSESEEPVQVIDPASASEV